MDRAGALAEFDEARDEFTAAIKKPPEESLGYLKPGDDYALGGLIHHVNWVLRHYGRVLDAVVEGDFGPTTASDSQDPAEEANKLAKAGLPPGKRDAVLSETAQLHRGIVARLDKLRESDWDRKAPIVYGQGDPYPTSPSDVLGWLKDHYLEHVPHAQQLHEDWKQARS